MGGEPGDHQPEDRQRARLGSLRDSLDQGIGRERNRLTIRREIEQLELRPLLALNEALGDDIPGVVDGIGIDQGDVARRRRQQLVQVEQRSVLVEKPPPLPRAYHVPG